jgi:hypothetical protein
MTSWILIPQDLVDSSLIGWLNMTLYVMSLDINTSPKKKAQQRFTSNFN